MKLIRFSKNKYGKETDTMPWPSQIQQMRKKLEREKKRSFPGFFEKLGSYSGYENLSTVTAGEKELVVEFFDLLVLVENG